MARWTKKQANELRERRENLDLSQGELAEKAGLSVGAISALENHMHDSVQDGTLYKLDRVLGGLGKQRSDLQDRESEFNDERKELKLRERSRKKIEKAIKTAASKFKEMWDTVVEEILGELETIGHREFESDFLRDILEGEGFTGIEITQQARDGGVDACCVDEHGKKVNVSAKHWANPVPPAEVQKIRGTAGCERALLVCLRAGPKAREEAEKKTTVPVQILSDGKLVHACLKAGLVSDITLETFHAPRIQA